MKNEEIKGIVSEIKPMAVHDGDGLRTTVFLKGCPLSCRWCHNPESISPKPQMRHISDKCTDCGLCAQYCPDHRPTRGGHVEFDDKCGGCGKCTLRCPNGALVLTGREMSSSVLIEKIMPDKVFFDVSGGGVTLSGGEPLMQREFALDVLRRLKDADVGTAVDTCGFVPWKTFEDISDYTDLYLYDIKAIDKDVHFRCTGQDNAVILDNLSRLVSEGRRIEIRIPFVPGFNDSEIPAIAGFLSNIYFDGKVKVLPYHPFARSKYASLKMPWDESICAPSHEETDAVVDILVSYGLNAFNGSSV